MKLKYLYALFFLYGYYESFSQGCVGGSATALSPTINYGNNAIITLNVPTGSIQWQYSSDNSNWYNVSGGTVSNVITNPSSGTTSFSYTGSVQNFIVPDGVTSINAVGLGGAGGSATVRAGGLGGKLIADLTTTPGETLYIYVGQKGFNGCCGSSGLGGWNGGGAGAASEGGGGGGATDIRQGGVNLTNRIFVVGGGGGAGQQRSGSMLGGVGGNGGGLTGQSGASATGRGGLGGTQSEGGTGYPNNGALGLGGDGGSVNGRAGGGGGGGFYGGGGGESGNGGGGGGGGGGSSYSTGSITTNTQGSSDASGNGSLDISYNIPASVTSSYTTNLTSPTYFRAAVTDGGCVAYSTSTFVQINPYISITNPTASLTACSGSVSLPTTFDINGDYLTSSVTITTSSGFEISTSSNGLYSTSLTLNNTGTLSQTLYIRMSTSAFVGVNSGTITASSTGATDATTNIIGTVLAKPTLSTSSISLCKESTYLITKTTVMPVDNGWSASGPIAVNNGYVTAGTTPGSNYTVSYTDGCAQTVSATVTVLDSNDPSLTGLAITDTKVAFKFNGSPQGPSAVLTVNYIGYDGYTYSSQNQPTQVGFYKANIQSGNNAGCPNRFYIFNCTTCNN
jgi:hypothetical protein